MRLVHGASLAAFVAGATAQFAAYTTDGLSYQVNIPSATAAGNGKTIFFQLMAPSGTQWIGLGQGSGMTGSNIFMVYAAANGNVTLSPRSGIGHTEPAYNSEASVTLLAGSGIASDGSMTANVRCDSCLQWSGGSMSPTDSNSAWIWALKSGSAVDSTDLSANLQKHDSMGAISFDLTKAVGGSSSNPFVVDNSSPSSGAPGASAASATSSGSQQTATQAVSTQIFGSSTVIVPVATSTSSGSSSGSSIATNVDVTRQGHAIVMSLVFVVLMPFAALTLYLPYTKKVPHLHAPLQMLSIILVIVGLALGIRLARPLSLTTGYHQVIGYVIVGILLSVQPILGLLQHLHFRKTGMRSDLGVGHRWLGRITIILGVINGGLGFQQSGPVGTSWVPDYAPILYGVVAVAVFVIYIAVALVMTTRKQNATSVEKYGHRGYEMHPSSGDLPLRQEPEQYRRWG